MIVDDFIARTPGSRDLAMRAARVLPDGVSTDTRYFEPYGIYVERALGVKKWDVDGNEYRDFFGGHGALMLGHSHPVVTEAIQKAAARGIQFAANHPYELEWAELLHKHIPTAHTVRFAGSGTEATLLAMRIARAYTGRAKILRIATHYHGWHDFAISGYANLDAAPPPGVLPEILKNTILIEPGNVEMLRQAIAANRNELAGIFLEPLGHHFGVIPTTDDFLRLAADLGKQNDIPVILDEVITGFRVSPSGFQSVAGIKPDLTCLGKVSAGGMPGGVVVGAASIMSLLSRKAQAQSGKKVFHQGTFTGNPVTASAAVATINLIVENDLCGHASKMGGLIRKRLNDVFKKADINWKCYGRYSGFAIFPDAPSGISEDGENIPWQVFSKRPVPLLQTLRMALNLEGVDMSSRGNGYASGVHQEEDVDVLAAGVERAIGRLRKDKVVQ